MKLFGILFIATFFLPAQHSLAQNEQRIEKTRFSRQEVREDLGYFYETLQLAHYNLYINTPKKVFDSHFKKLFDSITDSLTLLQITRLFQPFAALSNLAHCNISFPWALYMDNSNQKVARLFPFSITVKKNRAFITGNYSSDTSFQIGDEILSIDGVSINDKLNEIYRFLSGEGASIKNTLIDLISFPRIVWWINGDSQQFTVIGRHRDGREKSTIVNALPASAFEQQMTNSKTVFNLDRSFSILENTGYLHPGIFINNRSNGNTSEQETFETNEFLSFIDSSFRKLRKAKVQNLIIDLRGNPGGDNAFSDPMIAYFATQPFWFCSEFSVKTSATTKLFWKNVNDTSLKEMKNQILTRKDGEVFKVSFKNYPPKLDSLHYKGKVYVLIDRYSYSNAVNVAAIIQDYKFGVVLGEPTADVASGYGAIHEFKLPNSQLDVSYPKAFIVRPNGDKRLEGVTPDLIVEDDVFTTKDEILDFALKYINKQ